MIALPPSPPPVVRIVGNEYAYITPAPFGGGLVTLRFVNVGKEAHYLKVLRLPPGKTISDFNAARTGGAAVATENVGSPAAVAGGDSSEVTLPLREGRYVVVCVLPGPKGMSHMDLGMFSELVVLPPPAKVADEPRADNRIELSDYTFTLGTPLARGRQVVRVTNGSTQLHQFFLLRVPTGSSAEAEIALFRKGYFAERPTRSFQGLLELPPGATAWTTLMLDRGEYVLLCNAPGPDRMRHLDRGMTINIRVP